MISFSSNFPQVILAAASVRAVSVAEFGKIVNISQRAVGRIDFKSSGSVCRLALYVITLFL